MYTVYFEDHTIFKGYSNPSNWKDIPDKSITKLVYIFSDKSFVLEGFEEYTHQLEKIQALGKSFCIINKVYVLGRNKEISEGIIWNVPKHEVKHVRLKRDREYEGKVFIGWKKGKIGIPKVSLFRH